VLNMVDGVLLLVSYLVGCAVLHTPLLGSQHRSGREKVTTESRKQRQKESLTTQGAGSAWKCESMQPAGEKEET